MVDYETGMNVQGSHKTIELLELESREVAGKYRKRPRTRGMGIQMNQENSSSPVGEINTGVLSQKAATSPTVEKKSTQESPLTLEKQK